MKTSEKNLGKLPMQIHQGEKNRLNFLDYFPPPKFLAMPAVGLVFSERFVRFIELVKTMNGVRVGKFGEKELPAGTISAGYIANKEELKTALRSIKNENKLEFVNASLPEEKAYLFHSEIPRIEGADMNQVIEFKIEENTPISSKDATFDYIITNKLGRKDLIDVDVSVVPTKVVETYAEIIKEAGLSPLSFETEAQAASRSVIKNGAEETSMIINVGEMRTALAIVDGEVVKFTLTLPIGGNDITSGLAEHLSISLAEAERIKTIKGFSKDRESVLLLLPVIEKAMATLKNEVDRLFVYWQTHGGNKEIKARPITKIILCGKNSALAGFSNFIAQITKMEITLGDVWQNAFSYEDYIPEIPFIDSLNYAGAIGLALPEK